MKKNLLKLKKNGLLKGASLTKIEFYELCVKWNQTRVSFGTIIHNTQCALYYIHTYARGPSKVASRWGNHYIVTFVDVFQEEFRCIP